jgi:hypothetical protein
MNTPPHAATAESLLYRLYPWIAKVVHVRWRVRRSIHQEQAQDLLRTLRRCNGRVSGDLAVHLEGFLARLHREWFPDTWRPRPTYAEVVADFEWWLDVAERWSEPRRPARAPRRPAEPMAEQPPTLLRILALPANCTRTRFLTTWRRFLKAKHPDLNPVQSPEERRRFKEAVALWRR